LGFCKSQVELELGEQWRLISAVICGRSLVCRPSIRWPLWFIFLGVVMWCRRGDYHRVGTDLIGILKQISHRWWIWRQNNTSETEIKVWLRGVILSVTDLNEDLALIESIAVFGCLSSSFATWWRWWLPGYLWNGRHKGRRNPEVFLLHQCVHQSTWKENEMSCIFVGPGIRSKNIQNYFHTMY
jgi:hypothetical protein